MRRFGGALALALALVLAPACHEASQRGIWSIGSDPLVGCWRGQNGELLNVGADYRGPPLGPSERQAWSRETRTLISISDPNAGVKTIQTDFTDSTHVTLSYFSGTEIERLKLTRADSDAGDCQ